MRYLALLLLVLLAAPAFAQTDATKEQAFITNARQLIYEGKRSGEGYFSEDGKKLIFQSERLDENPFYQIYTLDLETGDVELVSTGDGKTTCAYFQWGGGNKILYSSTHKDPKVKQKQKDELDFRSSGQKRRYSWDYDETMDVFAAEQDGKNPKNLTSALGYDAEGSYSPDGKKIAFCSMRDAYNRKLTPEEQKLLEVDPAFYGEIYIMDADGKNVKRLTNYGGYDGGPFFSPDGKRIIWRRFTPDGMSADIFTMNIDGTDVKRVTEFKAMSWAPYYYPTQDYIIFASNKLGFSNFELYIVDTAGLKEPVQITYTDGFDGLPVFSPDGSKLAWTSTRTSGGASQLFLANWNHKAALEALKKAPFKGQGSGFTPAIKASEMQQKVEYLASDSLEGRMTGSKGIEAAAAYVSKLFNGIGLQPVGGLKDYKYAFEFVANTKVNKEQSKFSVTINGKRQYMDLFAHWLPQSFSMNGKASGDVVFAGYGIKSADKSAVEYNSYDGLDVKGKVVLVFNGTPPYLSDDDEKELLRYATPRYKALVARELGASAIIFVSEIENTFGSVHHENTPGNSGIVAVSINPSVADKLLAANKLTVAGLKTSYLEFNPHVKNETALKDVNVDLEVMLDKVLKTDYNLLGMIPATNKTDKYIFIGGHYDHLGYGETSSLASGEDIKQIHNGADDNASGTATVMELAEYFAQLKKDKPELFTRNLVFVLWSGEELGLVGSNKLAADSVVNMKYVEAYVNFDMVGRLKDNKLILQGLGSSSAWKKMIEKRNIMAGFNLTLQDDPYVPTDAMSLYQAGVPVLAVFTGIHDDYHRPSDDADKIDYEGMERIAKFAQGLIEELLKVDKIDYVKVEMSKSMSAGTKGFSVYLGTIPDYVAEVEGVRLSGVRTGAPADKAGLKEGDVIIKLAGKDIKNVYDYTYVLGDLQPDKTVEIIILRDGKQVMLNITPTVK
jgi:Tol biopolymer transport system component